MYKLKKVTRAVSVITKFCCSIVCELQMMIGNAKYLCLCVRYSSLLNTPLVVYFSIAFALLLVVIIIAIDIARRRHSKKAKLEQVPEDNETFTAQDVEERQYRRRLPDDYSDDSQV